MMLQSHLETIRKGTKEDGYGTLERFLLGEILKYDLIRDCPLFDVVRLARYKKDEILKPLENDLKEEDYKLN